MNHLIKISYDTPLAHECERKWLKVDLLKLNGDFYLYVVGQKSVPSNIVYLPNKNIIRPKREKENEICHLVVAFPDEIGFIFNQGPPHDRNYNYTNGDYLEVLSPNFLEEIHNSGGLIHIEVDYHFDNHIYEPLPLCPVYFENKVIMNVKQF
jgi:hypothetical protein